MEMRQFELREGTTSTVTWLPADRRLRTGARVSLKDSADPGRLWTVVRRGSVALSRDAIHSDWHVGGL